MTEVTPRTIEDQDLDTVQAGLADPEFKYVPVRRFMNDLPEIGDEVLFTGVRAS